MVVSCHVAKHAWSSPGRCVPSLLGLLAHENGDISADVIDLIHELTDADDADPSDILALVECVVPPSHSQVT